MCTSTQINYDSNSITHDYGKKSEFSCAIPEGSHWFKDITKNKEWQNPLRAFLMCQDLDRAEEVLGSFSGVPTYIWTIPDRKIVPVGAAFIDVDTDRFNLGCYGLGIHGCSRSVTLECAS